MLRNLVLKACILLLTASSTDITLVRSPFLPRPDIFSPSAPIPNTLLSNPSLRLSAPFAAISPSVLSPVLTFLRAPTSQPRNPANPALKAAIPVRRGAIIAAGLSSLNGLVIASAVF